MILIDTSAWIEFLRDRPGSIADAVEASLAADAATCDAIVMEVLAGARDEHNLAALRGLLARTVVLPIGPPDYERAAQLSRTCRRRGETVRKLIDCLIAAVAIAADVPLLHSDRDFEVLARHTGLRVHPASVSVAD